MSGTERPWVDLLVHPRAREAAAKRKELLALLPIVHRKVACLEAESVNWCRALSVRMQHSIMKAPRLTWRGDM